jgi:hypothetical protein
MTGLLELPDEVLIIVCRQVTLPDLYQLRLACRRLVVLIVSYSHGIAPFVACNTFPEAGRLLLKSGAQDFT